MVFFISEEARARGISPKISPCNEIISINHILTICHLYYIEKIKYNNIPNLYETIRTLIADNLIQFLKETGPHKLIKKLFFS
jgi:hypothetical protein